MSQPLIVSFRPDAAQMCLDGVKQRTRRIWKPEMRQIGRFNTDAPIGNRPIEFNPVHEIVSNQFTDRRRVLWTVGKSIAIKPSRTSKALGRVMCTGLHIEHMQDITEEEAMLEGVAPIFKIPVTREDITNINYRAWFKFIWNRIHPSGPKSWDANPLVVAIAFRPMEEGEA